MAESSASQQAAATGEPVVVDSETTQTTQVTANPDGTFTSTTNREPVRVNQGGVWKPIDTTLRASAANTFVPVASAADIAFSGGGTGPAVTVVDGDHRLSLSWPAALPTPTINGGTATYASVLPGVDLALTAEADSYTEVLVVHDASAASNPQLNTLHLTATATDLKVTPTADGGVSAADSTGTEIFHGTTPIMWDSSIAPGTTDAPTVDDPTNGHVTRLNLSVPTVSATNSTQSAPVTVSVPSQALTGPNVAYPLYIDPSFQETSQYYVVVSNDSRENYYNSGGQLKIGECPASNDPACGGSAFDTESYFRMSTTNLVGQHTNAVIYGADLLIDEIHSASGCTAKPVDLYSSNGIDGGTTYPGPRLNELGSIWSANGDNCSSHPAGYLDFNSDTVKAYVQTAANGNYPNLTFGIKADNDASQAQWKRFDSNVKLEVHYDYPPSTPTGLTISSKVSCPGKPVYTRDSTPELYAQAHDNNPSPLQVILAFATEQPGGANHVSSSPGITTPSDTLAGWTVPTANALPDGNYYFVSSARSDSTDTTGQAASGNSSAFYYTVDTTAPSAPTIDSFDYPQGAWGAPASQPGTFNVTSSSDTAGFSYAFDTSTVQSVKDVTCKYSDAANGLAPASGGVGQITAPSNLSPGPHTLYVKAFDDAHNMLSGNATAYQFYVAPTVAGEGKPKLEAEALPVTAQTCASDDPNLNCGGLANDPAYNEPLSVSSGGAEEHLVVPNVSSANTTSTPQDFNFTIPTPVAGDYALGVRLAMQNHFGILTFKLDGNWIQVNGTKLTVDTWSAGYGTLYEQLGAIGPTPDPSNPGQMKTTHQLTVEIIGRDSRSTDFVYNGNYGSGANAVTLSNVHDGGESAAIDFFTVVPISSATYSNVTAAMNNHGIAVDGTTPASIDLATNYALSKTALANATSATGSPLDLTAGKTAVIDQVPFVMPAANSNGNDNVMADGQTIDLPTPYTTATQVDLLALATCGTTASGQAGDPNDSNLPKIQATVNFDDGGFSSASLPAVPDWASASSVPLGSDAKVPSGSNAGITLAATLPYFDAGTAKNTSVQPRIYHIAIPTQASDRPISGVVLPYIGSNFLPSCTAPTLHILSIATSTPVA